MSVACSNTTETVFQVLDPIPVVPPGSTIAQYQEGGSTQLSIGVQDYTVTFVTQKASASYIFDAAIIFNSTDSPLGGLGFEITGQTINGFNLHLTNGTPDSINSFFRWEVRVLT